MNGIFDADDNPNGNWDNNCEKTEVAKTAESTQSAVEVSPFQTLNSPSDKPDIKFNS